MAAVRLEDGAVGYVRSSLAGVGGLAKAILDGSFRDPVVFAEDHHERSKLHDLAAQGIISQENAVRQLARYLRELKATDPSLAAVLFHDPWGKAGDLAYSANVPHAILQLPRSLLTSNGQRYFLYDIGAAKRRGIWQYRRWCVSYLKIGYVLEMAPGAIRSAAQLPDFVSVLAPCVRHVILNAYDDESWLVVARTP